MHHAVIRYGYTTPGEFNVVGSGLPKGNYTTLRWLDIESSNGHNSVYVECCQHTSTGLVIVNSLKKSRSKMFYHYDVPRAIATPTPEVGGACNFQRV